MSSVRCPLAAELDLPAERKVELCPEWIARVSGNMSFLVPSEIRQRNHFREWNWAHALAKRPALMADGIPVPALVDGDVPTLLTKQEVDWALHIYNRIFDIQWCLQLGQFDTRCLSGLPPFDPRQYTGLESDQVRTHRDVRRWRHVLQALLVNFMVEGDVLTNDDVYSGRYVPVPEGWHRFEVPYGLNVEVPTAVRLWGLTMANVPYREGETSHRRGAAAHALWSAFFPSGRATLPTQLWPRLQCTEMAPGCGGCRLGLIAGMRSIGSASLVGWREQAAEALRCITESD